jgi:pyruvate dehydrogenase complex dehydrogenase (E1) component
VVLSSVEKTDQWKGEKKVEKWVLWWVGWPIAMMVE